MGNIVNDIHCKIDKFFEATGKMPSCITMDAETYRVLNGKCNTLAGNPKEVVVCKFMGIPVSGINGMMLMC